MKDKKFLLAYVALANSYLKDNRLDDRIHCQADSISKEMLRTPQPDGASLRPGLIRRGKVYFNKAIDKNPSLPSALVNRANIAIRNNEFKRAEMDLKRPSSQSQSHKCIHISGYFVRKMGRYSDAKVSFKTALNQNPESATHDTT